MSSLQDFQAACVVMSGAGTLSASNKAIDALDLFVSAFPIGDRRNALRAAQGALNSLTLNGLVVDTLTAEIASRLASARPKPEVIRADTATTETEQLVQPEAIDPK